MSSAGDQVQDNVTKQILYLTLPHLFKSVKRCAVISLMLNVLETIYFRGHENTRGFDINEKKIRNRFVRI